MAKHFLELSDYSGEELSQLLDLSAELKTLYHSGGCDSTLLGKSVMMIFDKPSSRTRVSFEVAINQLGGSAVYSRSDDVGRLGEREPIKDLARVLNSYVDMIVVRTFAHESLQELAQYSTIPVINALTDQSHPCQAMADMLTIREHCGELAGKKLAFIGDGNNMAQSLAIACAKLGLDFSIATPQAYALNPSFWDKLNSESDTDMIQTNDPVEAIQGADIVYTDTWVSMGQEAEKQERKKIFAPYRVDGKLMAAAGTDAKVMHCLPAYRGFEITDDVMESKNSIIFEQAENRLHFQRALLKYLSQA